MGKPRGLCVPNEVTMMIIAIIFRLAIGKSSYNSSSSSRRRRRWFPAA